MFRRIPCNSKGDIKKESYAHDHLDSKRLV
nr:MAG TPA: hypothetical protein [Caudoviricetes sp.]